MNKLSAVIITRDEERNIRECLESIKWVDEIVVVDSESADRTVDICREYTGKVFVEEWKGFGRQKNAAIERTENEWILNIDADERVVPGLKGEIKRFLEDETDFDGFYIPRKSFFLGKWIKHCGWYPDYNLRLFKKGKGRFNERGVHESARLDGKIGYLKNPLEHYTYDSISDFLERMDRYSTLSAREMFKDGRRAGFFDILFRPELTFLKMYFMKMGFLEGYRGAILSALYSAYTLSKYAKLWEMSERQTQDLKHPRLKRLGF